MCVVAETPRIPREQKFWLVVYWLPLVTTGFLVAVGIRSGATTSQVAVLVIATVAALLGVLMAMRVARRRVTTAAFIKATTTMRVIAVAWVCIGLILAVVPIVSVLAGADIDPLWTAGFLGTVGSVSFLAIVGPAYSEYREALAKADDEG
jgi:hypothetical protein